MCFVDVKIIGYVFVVNRYESYFIRFIGSRKLGRCDSATKKILYRRRGRPGSKILTYSNVGAFASWSHLRSTALGLRAKLKDRLSNTR